MPLHEEMGGKGPRARSILRDDDIVWPAGKPAEPSDKHWWVNTAHRTACLAEGSEVFFDLPGGVKRRGNQKYALKIEDIWEKFQPTHNASRPDKQRNPYAKRDRIKQMRLRQVNADTLDIQHTKVVDVFKNGIKPIFRITLADGKTIECTKDHQFFFTDGWSTFAEACGLENQNGIAVWNQGDHYIHVNGAVVQTPALYKDKDWLNRVPWNKLTKAKLVRVESIEFVGEKMTYDLEVEGPHHNFICNGIMTHNSVNEYSTRYKPAIDSAAQTDPAEWRSQAKNNKQGSGNFLDPEIGRPLSAREASLQQEIRDVYEERLEHGVAREQARKDLPLSTYTEAYWKIDLHNLFHFLSLRMDPHAQLEIRTYANAIAEVVKVWVPWAWEAFEDYRLNGMYLTRFEKDALKSILSRLTANRYQPNKLITNAAEDAGIKMFTNSGKPTREGAELTTKLMRLLG